MKKYTFYLSIILIHGNIVTAGTSNSQQLECGRVNAQAISWTQVPSSEVELAHLSNSSGDFGTKDSIIIDKYEIMTLGNSLYGAVLIIMYSTFYCLFLLKLWPVKGKNNQ